MTSRIIGQERHIKDVSFHYSHISSGYLDIWRASLPEDKRELTLQPDKHLNDEAAAAMAKSSMGRKIVRRQIQEVFFSTFDMLIHTPASHEDLEAMNLAEVFNKIKSQI